MRPLLKVTQASRWNVDYALLVGPHSYRSFTCTALYHRFGSMQCVCTVVSSAQVSHLILHVYVTRPGFVVSECRH